ncbi:MAG: CoB--CoM heterodisulfide reductase iron-sulfur subunit B family protein [Pseudomonadota bacterium]
MKFTYYPGCSSHATSRAYDESTHAVAKVLGLEFEELDDWNCCGATAYMSSNEILSFCLSARNLALAKKAGQPVCTSCSSCYLNMMKTNKYLHTFPDLKKKVNEALAEADLSYEGDVSLKHILDVIVSDVGLDNVKALVKKPMSGLRVAPYYGCQIVRPMTFESDPEMPRSLEKLMETIGAEPTPFPIKTWCCGGSLMLTQEAVALRLCRNLLLCVQEEKADCIAVTCPLCQINLEAYQPRINRAYGTKFNIPVLYFTQILGLALGIPEKDLGMKRMIVPWRERIESTAEVQQ